MAKKNKGIYIKEEVGFEPILKKKKAGDKDSAKKKEK